MPKRILLTRSKMALLTIHGQVVSPGRQIPALEKVFPGLHLQDV